MTLMSDLLSFSKTAIDLYKNASAPLTLVQQYYFESLKDIRHQAVKNYIRSQDYLDEDLLDLCQQLMLERIFMGFTAMLIIAKCRMDQDFKVDLTEYVN